MQKLNILVDKAHYLLPIFAIKIDLNIVKGEHNLHTRLYIFLSDEEDLIS